MDDVQIWLVKNRFWFIIALIVALAGIVLIGCSVPIDRTTSVKAAALHPPSTDARQIRRIRVIYTVYRVA